MRGDGHPAQQLYGGRVLTLPFLLFAATGIAYAGTRLVPIVPEQEAGKVDDFRDM